ncbi:cbb3-type cytochrome c oxidase subunit I [Lichenicola sp.]|uniref:cbb3-type cytochrome c oxidase subunit I n=1 Tax=Lichenicola sp. TaxID=2804529 RepID=UPI003AFFCCCB
MTNVQEHWDWFLGRLTLSQIPYDNLIVGGAFIFAVSLGVLILAALTYYRKWGWLYREWLTTVDHKRVGIMYIIVGTVMLFRGFVDAIMMRTQQVMAAGPLSHGYMGAEHGYLPPYHYDQIYGSHGTIMLIFAATPILAGFMNYLVPLQIGARDMAFPYLNALAFWMTAVGAALTMVSLFVGDFSQAGWVGLAPLTELSYSPDVGVDYWSWALQIGSIGTTIGAVNIIATIIKMRAPGMTWMRLSLFTWTSLTTNVIGLTAFPVLGVAIGLLSLDRYLGTHFYTTGFGGNFMLYTDLFWIWGHPEVYFIILPSWGMMSEIIPTFSEKKLFGYPVMVAATLSIGCISWTVWLHHFFTMGAGAIVNSFYSIATMLVAIPTGVKVFDWALTMVRGRLTFTTPMLWAVSAIFMQIIGGWTGMMLAIPAINYMTHNSVFVIAHFHCVVMVTVFAAIGGATFWFPKMFGFTLNERAGQWVFWLLVGGSFIVFTAMFMLGLTGMPRRLAYVPYATWWPLLVIEEIGIFVDIAALAAFIWQITVSIRDRNINRAGQDPWGTARSLEWITHSPVPDYNFAVIPHINARDEWAWRREHHLDQIMPEQYEDIELPLNTPVPMFIGACTFAFGFAMVWRIWWLAIASLIAIFAIVIFRSFDDGEGTIIKADEVRRRDLLAARPPAPRRTDQYIPGAVTAFNAGAAE